MPAKTGGIDILSEKLDTGIPSSPADFNWDGVVDEQDLALMEACMGATDDPNRVRMDLNADSWVNLPDLGIFAKNYGYTADPNLPGHHDPNSARSDFSGDGMVNLEDLAIVAEHWLTAVFGEKRLCGLCNLHSDPNIPPGRQTIDDRDRNAFWAEWGKVYASDPNILIEQEGGRVWIGIGQPQPAWRISAFLDGEHLGSWQTGMLGVPVFEADLTRLGPGSHRLRVVRNIDWGLEITERVIEGAGTMGLYYADIPETFEPNEPYRVRGFSLGENELNLRLKDALSEQILYDVNILPGPADVQIPPSAFEGKKMAVFSAASAMFAEEEQERYEAVLSEKFERETYRGKWIRFLVLLPDRRVTATYKEAVFAALAAIEKRTSPLSYIVLTGTEVNYDNLRFSLWNTYGVKTIIFFGHANSHVGRIVQRWTQQVVREGVQRTQIQCYARREGYFRTQYENVGMASYTRQTRPDAEPLPDGMDQRIFDFSRLVRGANDYPFIKVDQMYVFGCLSARYPDMAIALGCNNLRDHSFKDMLYCGFTEDVTQNNAIWFLLPRLRKLLSLVNQGLVIFFNALGEGDTIPQAVSVLQQQDVGIREALFGKDGNLNNTQGLLDRDSTDDDTLTFYGLGYVGNRRFGYYGAQQ